MIGPFLATLEFRSNNVLHRPVIAALELLKAHRDSKQRFFALDLGVLLEGVVRAASRDIILEKDASGTETVKKSKVVDAGEFQCSDRIS